jgi:hypothetical protein
MAEDVTEEEIRKRNVDHNTLKINRNQLITTSWTGTLNVGKGLVYPGEPMPVLVGAIVLGRSSHTGKGEAKSSSSAPTGQRAGAELTTLLRTNQ